MPFNLATHEEKINFSEKNLKIGLNFKLHLLLFTKALRSPEHRIAPGLNILTPSRPDALFINVEVPG